MMTKPRFYRADGTEYQPFHKGTPRPTHAPFDRVRGEHLGDLGDAYEVVPERKWEDTPVLNMAWARAQEAMQGSKLGDTRAEILVQEYYGKSRLVIIVAVWAKPKGRATWQWVYTVTEIKIEGRTRADLVLAGRWKTGAVLN